MRIMDDRGLGYGRHWYVSIYSSIHGSLGQDGLSGRSIRDLVGQPACGSVYSRECRKKNTTGCIVDTVGWDPC